MKIYSALQIGEYHTNHCEDYLFIGQLNNNKIVCAVMDGCTTATDSYFAATLVGKLLRKIVKEKGYKELYRLESHDTLEGLLKSIMAALFAELKAAKNQLMLDFKELLTTLIIMVADETENKGIVLVIGDGLVSINGAIAEFDQDNKPDYVGFHLSEDFDTWYKAQIQKIAFTNLKDVSIATDGILTFTPVKKVLSQQTINIIDFLLIDNENAGNEDMLNLKLKNIEHEHGLKPTDDLAIIRIKA